MKDKPISFFDIDDYESVLKQIQKMQYKIYYIDGTNISTMEDFFNLIKNVLPSDPPATGVVNFDGFTDSLWGGVHDLPDDRVAIAWKNPEALMGHHRFEEFLDCIKIVTNELVSEECHIIKPTILRTFLFGKGERFLRFFD